MTQTRTALSPRGVSTDRLQPAHRQASQNRRSPVRTTSPHRPKRYKKKPNTWGQIAKDLGMTFVKSLFNNK